jgi:cytochrome c oxidase subunit II
MELKKKLAYLLTATALVLALAACGSNQNSNAGNQSPPSPEASASQELVITATTWTFDKPEYTIPKDTPVKLSLENTKGMHGVEIVGQGITFTGNNSKVVTLPAGTYEIKCNIMCGNGHNQMKAKLVVS